MREKRSITITDDARKRATGALRSYLAEHWDEEVGDLKAGLLLDFILAELGPTVYNQAIADARAFFEAFGWVVTVHDSLEADDLLGSYARLEARAGGSALVMTGDRDMFQCVEGRVTVLYVRTGGRGAEPVGPADVRKRYGVASLGSDCSSMREVCAIPWGVPGNRGGTVAPCPAPCSSSTPPHCSFAPSTLCPSRSRARPAHR